MQRLKKIVLLFVIKSFVMQASENPCIDIPSEKNADTHSSSRGHNEYNVDNYLSADFNLLKFAQDMCLKYQHHIEYDKLKSLLQENIAIEMFLYKLETKPETLCKNDNLAKCINQTIIDIFKKTGASKEIIADLCKQKNYEAKRMACNKLRQCQGSSSSARANISSSTQRNIIFKKNSFTDKQQDILHSNKYENNIINNQEPQLLEYSNKTIKKRKLESSSCSSVCNVAKVNNNLEKDLVTYKESRNHLFNPPITEMANEFNDSFYNPIHKNFFPPMRR